MIYYALFYIPGIFISITMKFQNLLTVGQYRLEIHWPTKHDVGQFQVYIYPPVNRLVKIPWIENNVINSVITRDRINVTFWFDTWRWNILLLKISPSYLDKRLLGVQVTITARPVAMSFNKIGFLFDEGP